jgi:hypothetical protein
VPQRHFRLAVWLGVAGAVSTALVFPYLLELMPGISAGAAQAGVGLPVLIGAQAAQAFVLFTFMSWVGLRVGQPMGLDAPILRSWVYGTRMRFDGRVLVLACAIGIVGAMAIVFIDHSLQPYMPPSKSGLPAGIERWKGLLASFYGGIGEELQLRLFLMTLLTWLAWKLLARARPSPPPLAAWIAIVLAALVFAAGHLPAAAQIWPLDATVVFRTLSLNAIVGVPCGWLFYRHGLEHAMAAHFSADIVLHVASA